MGCPPEHLSLQQAIERDGTLAQLALLGYPFLSSSCKPHASPQLISGPVTQPPVRRPPWGTHGDTKGFA